MGRRAQARGSAWVDVLLPLAAIGALTATVQVGLPVRTSTFAGSDMKTVYASAWCLRHGLNAYRFSQLRAVFLGQGVTPPPNWYGHAPVYPPSTLAVVAPLTSLSMVHAVYLMMAVSALLMVCATAALLRYGQENFGLTLANKACLVALFAAGPLLAFGLSVGNLSVAAAALSIVAFAGRKRRGGWAAAGALGLALLLKPHLAVWMGCALLFLPERGSRRVAIRGAVIAIAVGLLAPIGYARGQWPMQIESFLAVMRAEIGRGGSMNVGSHEALPVVAQITSLHSLIGFWTASGAGAVLAAVLLAGVFGLLAWQTLCVRGERYASLAAGAWCAFGLLTTYHRAHDATVLLILTPWLLDSVRKNASRWQPWAIAGFYLAMSVGPSVGAELRDSAVHGGASVISFLLQRQAGIADVGLLCVLAAELIRVNRRVSREPIEWTRIPVRVHEYQKSVSTVGPGEVTATTSQ